MLFDSFETIEEKVNSAIKALKDEPSFVPEKALVAADLTKEPQLVKEYVDTSARRIFSILTPEAQVAAFIATVKALDETALVKARATMAVPECNESLLQIMKDSYNWNYFEVLVDDKKYSFYVREDLPKNKKEIRLGEFRMLEIKE